MKIGIFRSPSNEETSQKRRLKVKDLWAPKLNDLKIKTGWNLNKNLDARGSPNLLRKNRTLAHSLSHFSPRLI